MLCAHAICDCICLHFEYATAVTCRANAALHRPDCFFSLQEKSTSLQIDVAEIEQTASPLS